MFLIDRLILLAAVLLLAGIVSSKFSSRVGLPVLVLFLGIGMLAGEDGIGGIAFDDVTVAHGIGTLALAIILFDGGLQTRWSALRAVWKPSLLLATVGVSVTALVTGLAAAFVLGVSPLVGLLFGSIVASTDAAAVFSILRSQGLHLRTRVAGTLEVESGSNDPMAIFMTVGLLEVLTGRLELGPGLLILFVQQMGIGTVVGLGAGWLAVRLVNRIELAAPGLYPVLAGACGLTAFGVAAQAGGSGFLAIYLAGIVIGNSRTVFQRGTFLFMDGLAWISQITMFVVLGLLSTPSDVVPVAGAGVLLSAVLFLVARPLAVVPLLLPFRFTMREHVLISWGGLKGAVPIILATFPLMLGLPGGTSDLQRRVLRGAGVRDAAGVDTAGACHPPRAPGAPRAGAARVPGTAGAAGRERGDHRLPRVRGVDGGRPHRSGTGDARRRDRGAGVEGQSADCAARVDAATGRRPPVRDRAAWRSWRRGSGAGPRRDVARRAAGVWSVRCRGDPR